ncbi:MAG TPA: transglutaminaseTgpA domain-containing protein [Holophagaceae bacterium]|nr:transglutaminaseTgpA domain-containing protein [Holophagaceae bacterium]
MRHARWLDHLPLWAVYGAVARTRIFEPWELVFMAAPLVAAVVVEGRRWDLSRWRLPLELAVIAWLAFDLLAHPGFFGQMVRLLFLLSGLRLALPRQPPQRRQLLLMGFLLFLTTAISNADFEFFAWTILWMLAATLALLQLAWEQPASLRHGPSSRPPFRLVPFWAAGALALAGCFFLLLPRLNAGWRPFPAFGAALGRLQAGLSDQVDLSQQGPISVNHAVVMRVVPPADLSDAQRQALGGYLAYLRGITLEKVEGQRWEPYDYTRPRELHLGSQSDTDGGESGVHLEFFLNPTPRGLVPLPYGTVFAGTPFQQRLRSGEGASWHLPFPVTRGVPLQVVQADPQAERFHAQGLDPDPVPLDDARPPFGQRLDTLLELRPEHEAARRTSLAWAPGVMKAPALASALSARLRTFRYTLDNPCGTAANPLQDFLERTQAGHCEYFASALALMLRARGVPARVVNGYRLGAWVPEGGYWLVTEDEAHSWVEYWDDGAHIWRMADGTPAFAAGTDSSWSGTWTRLADAVSFKWDRYVVRFSGEDQAVGLVSIQSLAQNLAKGWRWSWKRPSPLAVGLLGMLGLAWFLWRFRPKRQTGGLAEPKGVKAFAPLLRRTRGVAPPNPGETSRHWLARLARLRPDRAEALHGLSEAADRTLYGGGRESALSPLVKAEARAWK